MGAYEIFNDKRWGTWEFYSDILGAFMDGFVRSTDVAPASVVTAGTDITVADIAVGDTILSFGGLVDAVGTVGQPGYVARYVFTLEPSDITITAGNIAANVDVPAGDYVLRWFKRQA